MRMVTAAAMLGLVSAGCGTDPVRATLERLYEATTPPMGSATTLVYGREPTVVNASWEVVSSLTWERYVESVRSAIASDGFTPVATTDTEVTFRRMLDGDIQMLQLRVATDSAAGRVVATFTSRPF